MSGKKASRFQKSSLEKEEGFWAAMYLIFLVTLGLMGAGAFVLVRSEAANSVANIGALQTDYTANGAAYYGIRRLELGALDERSGMNIGGAVASFDSTLIGSDILLYVNSSAGDLETRLRIRLRARNISDMAIYAAEQIWNVETRDSTNIDDPSLQTENVDSLPAIDIAGLYTLSLTQGHDQLAGEFRPPDGYPGGDFYQPDGITPNVTHVYGDLRVQGGTDVYGIFAVDGAVRLDGSARVHGVIYVINNETATIHGGGNPTDSSVEGGIVTNGQVAGTGSHANVRHQPEYMRAFARFVLEPLSGFRILAWEYL